MGLSSGPVTTPEIVPRGGRVISTVVTNPSSMVPDDSALMG